VSGPYTRAVQPPAPVLSITLRSEATDLNTAALIALVDTGADATIVPIRRLAQIGAEETAPGWLVGITGGRLPVGIFFVDIRVGDVTFPGARVVGSPIVEEVLLGRGVLNRLALLLDGREQYTSVLDESAAARFRGRR
jgi:predicted aspartyl protease